MHALLTTAARKAWTGAAVSFLSPLGVLLAATDEPLSTRSVLASLVAGVIGGLGVYGTTNTTQPGTGRTEEDAR